MPNQETLIACRVCDRVFFDNKSLFDHYTRLHVGSFECSVNGRNFFSGASHTCFTSVPMTDVNSSAKRYFGPHNPNIRPFGRWQLCNTDTFEKFFAIESSCLNNEGSVVSSLANFHSPISTSTLSSCPKQSSDSHFRFSSQPTGQPSFHYPRSHVTRGISNSQASASTSKPTRRLNFHSPIDVGASTSESMSGGTRSLSCVMESFLLKSTRQSEVHNLFTGYSKPYIMQLEHSGEEMTVLDPNDNSARNFKPDEIDLRLKL